MHDKMTSIDVLRMAENLQCRVVIPIHWDVWTNFQADCEEIKLLYDLRRTVTNIDSIRFSGRWEANIPIRWIKRRFTIIIGEDLRIVLRLRRTSRSVPACKMMEKKHDILICVDSDGCAMDTMNIKHMKCFGPCLVEEWGLGAVERRHSKTLG